MENKELIIKVDTNDGDYVIGINKISEKNLALLIPLIEIIKKNKGCFEYGEMFDCWDVNEVKGYNFPKEIMEMFIDYCPSTEYGFHTIESITVSPIVKKTILYSRWEESKKWSLDIL